MCAGNFSLKAWGMPVPGQVDSRGGDSAGLCRLAAAAIVGAALAAYAGGLRGPLLYDDAGSVANNPSIRHFGTALAPPSSGWPVSGRPVFNFSLALNYALSGLRTPSYHLLSLLIHLAAGLVLFGIVRRTLARMGFSELRALGVGWAAALLWTLHPLQTESVTYISQRAESLVGLCYFLTLYGFIRWVGAGEDGRGRRRVWAGVSVGACLLGMASKEVMITAPVLVLLYDRVFVARSWRGLAQRKVYYGALAASWIVLALLMARGGGRGGTVGFGVAIAWWAYGLTQFRAVAHYLRLCFWPHPLLFAYGLTLGGPPAEIVLDAIVVLGLAAASLGSALRGSRLGFLGAWFFIILSPTSSIVPVATELIAEHRAYLSLAAVAVLVVWGADQLRERLALRWGTRRALVTGGALALVALTAGAEGMATHRRTQAYASVLALWGDTVADSPDDAGARNNYGNALAEAGRLEEAMAQYRAALRLVPGYDQAHLNLGNTLVKLGREEESLPHFRAALQVTPDDAGIRYALGSALAKLGRRAEARAEFKQALRGRAASALVWYLLGNALLDDGQLEAAEGAYAAAIRLRPDYADALVNHAGILAQLNQGPAAIAEFQAALRLQPGAADVHNNLGGLLAEAGRLAEAQKEFEAALALQPDYREARDNLLRVKAMDLAAPR